MRAAWLVLLAGCWRSEPAAPPPVLESQPAASRMAAGPTCEEAIDNTMEVARDMMDRQPAMTPKVRGDIRDLVVRRCHEDDWSGETISCMARARADDETTKCQDGLSQEQRAKLEKDLIDALMPVLQQQAAPPPTPPTPPTP
jgi:hypothetical protein